MTSDTDLELRLRPVFRPGLQLDWQRPNLAVAPNASIPESQRQTSDVFGQKWMELRHGDADFHRFTSQQCRWYLYLYGFQSEADLTDYIRRCSFVIDCGAGLGSKAAWFASMSPETIVVAVDHSDSVNLAADFYADSHPNLLFVRGDIGDMPYFQNSSFDYVNCDQVIHHTANPPETFRELVRLTKPEHDLTCYVYRRKALPRELLDEHFRTYCKTLSQSDLIELSKQLTELGRILSEDDRAIDFPSVKALGIEGGRMPVQRFIYWNFIKCFWNAELGEHVSMLTNYDWYSPSQAFRYSEEEFRDWISGNNLEILHFHKEEACYSGRFRRSSPSH